MTDPVWQYGPDFLQAIDVHELLPQQEPFVMIGKIVAFDEKTIVTETVVRKDNIFTDNDRFTPSGLIENIAQTCAARIGFINKCILKKGIQVGFIGAIRDLQIVDCPTTDQCIRTTVVVREEVFGMILADATIECDGRVIVSTEMKIALQREDSE